MQKPEPSRPDCERYLICPDSVFWAADAGGTIVINEQQSEVHILHGTENAVWSWLTLGYSFSDIISFLSIMLNVSSREAEKQVNKMLRSWICSGLLQEMPDHQVLAVQTDSRPKEEEPYRG
jgi:hypothetical protein